MEFSDFLSKNGIEILRHGDIKLGADNELIKDKRGKFTVYYSLSHDGMFGRAYDCRTDTALKFVSGNFKKLDPDERSRVMAEQAEKLAEQKKLDIELQKAAIENGKVFFESLDNANQSEYFKRKGVPIPKNARQDNDSCLIPFNDIKGDFCGYQTICNDGGKYFMPRSKIKGSFYKIDGDDEHILICEGVATGQTIHLATGFAVYVAFNAGNLFEVGKSLRGEYPTKKIIICADNDQWSAQKHFDGYDKSLSGDNPKWSEWRDAGLLYNTGIMKANEAAAKLGAHVCYPEIASDDNVKRSDFNDIGVEETEITIMKVIEAINSRIESEDFSGDIEIINDTKEVVTFDPLVGDFGQPFRCMGYNEDHRIYYSFLEKQVIELKTSEHNFANLIRLGNWEKWREWFSPRSEISDSTLTKRITAALNDLCVKRDAFNYDGRVRGAGCWVDGKKHVVNTGDRIIIDGEERELYEVRSNNIYVISSSKFTPAIEPLTNKEANDLRELCALCPWEREINADLLAGAIVVGQVCAVLNWRPIIWISGQKGTGKSTILERLLKPALGDIALHFTRGTTEASIRQKMKYDARPVIYDEAEPSATMEAVMGLAKAATGGTADLGKFGQGTVKPRSSFFFSSTDTFAKDLSEESRIVILRLKQPRGVDRTEQYEAFLAKIKSTLKNNFSGRLLKRTVDNLPVLFKNIEVFTKALNATLKDSRSSDQIAPLLAGAYMLTTLKEISYNKALEIVERTEWENYTTYNEEPDHQRLLDKILSSMVYHSKENVTIGELIKDVAKNGNTFADTTLRNHGIIVARGYVSFANRHENLKKILSGTQWEHSWSRTLGDFEDSKSMAGVHFSAGIRSRAIQLPVKTVLGEIYND